MNSANMSMVIKRDGKGVPLPLNMQDMRILNNIQGFIPKIREIRPVTNTPFFNHLQENIQA